MNGRKFREMCEEVGGEFEEPYVDEDFYDEENDEVFVCRNDNGDEVWFRDFVDDSGKRVHEVNFEPEGYTIDRGYRSIDPHDVKLEDHQIVIEGVSGTRSSSGYGVTGFTNGRFEFGKYNTDLYEKH